MGSFCRAKTQNVKHVTSVMLLLSLVYVSGLIRLRFFEYDFSAMERYGIALSCVLYLMQMAVISSLPFSVFNFLGVVFINVFRSRPKLKNSTFLRPFLCFRVVTRGRFPNLVNKNVLYNLEICENVGLQRFLIEVVTDLSVQLKTSSRTREVVVPEGYETSNRTKFKGRALQYALEPDVNILGPEDWIVHLDEETRLTEEAVLGIMNFVNSGKHSFGQGAITYGKGQVINWITTLADSIRVGIDYGCYRFTLGVLHKPIFSWKGSFIVARVQAEIDVSFDHGPDSSIAEDCFFACLAFSKGYSFDYVEGEMAEMSTFTFKDFIQQRRRWMYGILLTVLSNKIPLLYKMGPIFLTASNFIMPFNLLLWPMGVVWPLPMCTVMIIIYSFILGTVLHLYLLGTILTFFVKQQYGLLKCLFLLVATLPCCLLACVLENVSSVLVFWMPKTAEYSFHIVKKESEGNVHCI